MFILALLALLSGEAGAVGITNPGFEQGAAGWTIETGRAGDDAGGPNRVEFITEGAFKGHTCVKLRYRSSWLWLTTSPLPGSVSGQRLTVAMRAKWLAGANLLSVGFTEFEQGTHAWAGAHDALALAQVPKDRRWHLLEFRLDVPAFDTATREIGVKFGCSHGMPSEMLADAVAIPEVATGRAQAAAPKRDAASHRLRRKHGVVGGQPASGFRLDDSAIEGQPTGEVKAPAFLVRPAITIRSSRLGESATAGPVRLRGPARIEPRLGRLTPLVMTVRNRSSRAVSVSLRSHCPAGVTLSGCDVRLKPHAERTLQLDLRTLQALPHEVILEAAVGRDHAGLSVPVEPRRAFPVFGVVEHFDRTPPGRERAPRDAAMLAQMPCAAYRIDCGWASIDPGGGKPYEFASTDWYVKLVRETGHAPILMMLGYFPPWAAPFDDPTDEAKMAAYRRAVRAIVQRYADQVDYWEAWNEPLGFWFGGDRKAYLEKGPAMLLAVQKTVWEAVREFDPTGVVLTPGLMPWYHRGEVEWKMVTASTPWVSTATSTRCASTPTPSRTCSPSLAGYRLDGREAFPVEAWPRLDRAVDLQGLLDLLDRHHSNKPLWVTEFGGFDSANERAQALACLHTLGVVMPQRVQGALYYELFDYPHDAHPPVQNLLRNRDLHRTLGFVAYQDMIRALTGASYDPGAATVRVPNGVESRCFRRPGETVVLLWSNRADTTTARVRWSAQARGVVVTSWDPARDPMRGSAATDVPEEGRTVTLHPLEFVVIVARSGP